MSKSVLQIPISGDHTQKTDDTEIAQESIEERARANATKAGQRLLDWQASYVAMIKDVSGFYSTEINKIIYPINKKLGAYLNGLTWDLKNQPDAILLQADNEYKASLNDAMKYNHGRVEFNKKLEKEKQYFPDLSEDDIRKTTVKTPAHWTLFFAILGIIVLLESVANMALLARALEGGLIQAFLVATLVSIINVMGVGTGVGFFLAFLFRKLRKFFNIALPIWFGTVLLLNLEVGRHREGFILDIEAKERAAESTNSVDGLNSLVVVSEKFSDVTYSLHSWHFESVLFFLLGIVLSCFGFYKGFCFLATGENLKLFLDKLDALKEKVEQKISSMPNQYREQLEDLRKKVSDEISQINEAVSSGDNKFQDMEAGWNILIDVIGTEFINSYNQAHPGEKITMETIASAKVAAKFPATPADRDSITKGMEAMQEYRSNEQTIFNDKISSINEKIAKRQEEYLQATSSQMRDVYA